MKNWIKYLIWKATGKSRTIRIFYILLRVYKFSLLTIKQDLRVVLDTFSNSEDKMLIKKILSCMYKYGISIDEYFLFDFELLNHKQRQSYLTTFNRLYYYSKLNDSRYDNVFTNKYVTYQYYKKYFKRELLFLNKNDFEEFRCFVNRNSKFIYKPASGSCGEGIKIYDLEQFSSIAELFSLLTEKEGIVEELIIQHDDLGRFHPKSINTVRIPHVITIDGDVVIFAPILRVGQKNSIVDNGGAGGILANIDPVTGVVYTDGADEFGNLYSKHPSTNVTFKGFQIPKWDEAVSLVKEMSQVLPTMGYIGWDLALTPNGWIVVEANNEGTFKVLQIADKRGLKNELCKMI